MLLVQQFNRGFSPLPQQLKVALTVSSRKVPPFWTLDLQTDWLIYKYGTGNQTEPAEPVDGYFLIPGKWKSGAPTGMDWCGDMPASNNIINTVVSGLSSSKVLVCGLLIQEFCGGKTGGMIEQSLLKQFSSLRPTSAAALWYSQIYGKVMPNALPSALSQRKSVIQGPSIQWEK